MALNLNQSWLPEGFVAEARVKLGGQVQIDVGTFTDNGPPGRSDSGGIVLWSPPMPTERIGNLYAELLADPTEADRGGSPPQRSRNPFSIAACRLALDHWSGG
jgi:hypothetical protein